MSASGWTRPLLLAAWLLPILLFAVGPVALLVFRSAGVLDESAWRELLGQGGPLANTVLIALGAAAFALLLGGPLAFLLFRTDLPWRGPLVALFTLPSAVPPPMPPTGRPSTSTVAYSNPGVLMSVTP